MIIFSKTTDGPSEFPVTLSEVKVKMKVTGDDEDAVITGLIKTATKMCESDSGLSFTTQDRTITLDRFPCGTIILPYGPVSAVKTFTYIDANGQSQSLIEDTHYILDKHNNPARAWPVDSWPTTKQRLNAVTIVYTAGFGDASSVPQGIKDAIMSLVATMYEHRQEEESGVLTQITWGAQRMLDPYRVEWYAKV